MVSIVGSDMKLGIHFDFKAYISIVLSFFRFTPSSTKRFMNPCCELAGFFGSLGTKMNFWLFAHSCFRFSFALGADAKMAEATLHFAPSTERRAATVA